MATSVADIINSKPHIDELHPGLLGNLVMNPAVPFSKAGTAYCLPHHHFKLKEGEVLLFDIIEDHKSGKIKKILVSCGPRDENMKPFQYFSDGEKYIPIGFTHQEKYQIEKPGFHFPGIGVISTAAFTDKTVEITDEENRVQILSPMHATENDNHGLYTMVQKKLVAKNSTGAQNKCPNVDLVYNLLCGQCGDFE